MGDLILFIIILSLIALFGSLLYVIWKDWDDDD